MISKSLKHKGSSDFKHSHNHREIKREEGGRGEARVPRGPSTHTTPWRSHANARPVPTFSFLVSQSALSPRTVSFRSRLSESDALFKEGLREMPIWIYRAIITHHRLVRAGHRESRSVWMGSLYFTLMGAQSPEWSSFRGSQPWPPMRITWGAFKKLPGRVSTQTN